jgi:hypothetical protein
MWLTGFDAPSCSTVYLDKPMRNHTLMQTIARANRVFPGKHSGVIVDYANVFTSLEKALAIYGADKDGESPVRNKQQLVEELRRSVADATAFWAAHGVTLAEIGATPVGSMERLSRIEDGMNVLISPDSLRRDFFAHERLVSTLWRLSCGRSVLRPKGVPQRLAARDLDHEGKKLYIRIILVMEMYHAHNQSSQSRGVGHARCSTGYPRFATSASGCHRQCHH